MKCCYYSIKIYAAGKMLLFFMGTDYVPFSLLSLLLTAIVNCVKIQLLKFPINNIIRILDIMKKYKSILGKFSKKKILVIGDVILDRYVKGSVSRISPEAPVPVVLEEESFYTPGGAANVANNLKALGAEVLQVGRIGHDFEGKLLKRELKRAKN